MPDQAPFFVTTPIYYVNARPHIGHAYTTLVADTLARRARLLGRPTFFLTGTDEHGQKIERSATAAGIPPEQFTTVVSDTFRHLWHRMGITYTGSPAAPPSPFALPTFHRPEAGFIRTTDPEHTRGVGHLFRELQRNGFIEKGTYTGQYCVSDEAYVEGLPGIHCPDCGRLTETVSEENYYFKLSAFQLPLLDLIEYDTLRIRPDSAKNEVHAFLTGNVRDLLKKVEGAQMRERPDGSGEISHIPETLFEQGDLARTQIGLPYVPGALKDLSISRTSFSWGVPVPGDEKHVIYVWLDALANYMTALGYGAPDSDSSAQALFQTFWPADLHLVGKEITRFHCIYWPAFLLALNPALKHAPDEPVPTLTLEQHQVWAEKWLPKEIVANGWLLFDNSKMSKSKGNVVRAETILTGFGETYLQGIRDHNARELKKDPAFQPVPDPSKADQDLFATDVLRYFLLREIPFGQDGSFSFEAMVTRYNADLVNGYANLVSRTLKQIQSDGEVPSTHADAFSVEAVYAGDDLIAFGTQSVRSNLLTTAKLVGESVLLDRRAIDQLNFIGHVVDDYLSANSPWKLDRNAPSESSRRDEVLYTAAESIRILTALLYPILPFATARVWAQLGLGSIEAAAANGDLTNLQWGGLQPGTRLGPLAPIFPRADKGLAQTMADLESTPPPSLLDVANDEHDATRNPDHTAFREAPLSSVAAGMTDQTAVAEARSETSAAPAPVPVPAEPTGTLTTDPAAGPRTASEPTGNPIAQVGGSFATTTATPAPTAPTHVAAEPSGIFTTPASTTPVSANPADASPQITIDDFAKVELRVAQILVAERIPKADKLLRLEVDLGPLGRRQILSGIAEWYPPETLLGRRIVVITNLAPRKMRGLDSHGMLLAASDGDSGKPVLATFPDSDTIPLGSRLK